MARMRCAHVGCACVSSSDDGYCGRHCEVAQEQQLDEPGCGCGHFGCDPKSIHAPESSPPVLEQQILEQQILAPAAE